MQRRDGIKEIVREALKRICEEKRGEGATAEEINEEIARIIGRKLSKGAIYTAIRELEENGEIKRISPLRPFKYCIAEEEKSEEREEKGEEEKEEKRGEEKKGEERKEGGEESEGEREEDLSAYIPKEDNEYIARKIGKTTDIEILKKCFENKINVLLVGKTGAGKTHAARRLAYELKMPYMRVNANGAITPDDLLGQYIPDGNGGFRWCDGVLTRFVRHGGIFVLDEINAAPAEILFVLHSLLDDERKIVLTQKDGEVVKANDKFMFIATMNPAEEAIYEGTKEMNAALKDRFGVVLYYDYDEAIERKLIKSEYVREVMKKLRESEEIETPISTRMGIEYEKAIELFGIETANEILIAKFRNEEKEIVREALTMIYSKFNENGEEGEEESEEE